MSVWPGWASSTLRAVRYSSRISCACSPLPSTAIQSARSPIWEFPRRLSSTSTSASKQERFDILFCGSDAFSTASFKAVLDAKDVWRSLRVLVPQEKMVRVKGTMRPVEGVLSEFAKANQISVDQVPAEGISAYQLPEAHSVPSTNSLLITASFGHLLPGTFLDRFLPTHALNVHPSLLPRWRGAAPVQWTIANGDTETGVTVQKLEKIRKGVDSGEIVGVRSGIPVPADATYDTLLPVLADVGGELLVEVLRAMQSGSIMAQVQDTSLVTRAPKIHEDIARIRSQTADQLDRLSRGISHQQPIWTSFNGHKVQLTAVAPTSPPPSLVNIPYITRGLAALDKKAQVLRLACAPGPSGMVYNVDGRAWEKGEASSAYRDEEGRLVTWLGITRVKPAGRKEMGVMEWWNGLPRAERAGKYIKMGGPMFEEVSDTATPNPVQGWL